MTKVNKKLVHTVFEAAAEKYPAHVAVRQGEREISYEDLNRRSGELADLLKQAGVGRDVIVGIGLAAGIEYVTALLAVMKAGGLFLPLDLSLPEQRLAHILQKTPPTVLIGAAGIASDLDRIQAGGFDPEKSPLILLDSDLSATCKTDRRQEEGAGSAGGGLPDPDDGCYIIYTSGSTGTPKAIEGCYKSLSHFVHWEVKAFELDETARVTQLAPVTFDASLRDIFVPLIIGGTLCIPTREIRGNTRALVRWMETEGVTLVHCVPSLFRMITREVEDLESGQAVLPALRHILMAGEPLYGKDVIRWMDRMGERVTLVNLYGASETTLVKSFHPIRQRPQHPNAMIPVGQPISNTAILVVKAKRLCEPGEIGEIFIKTPFRTKGYYGDPALTRKSFVPNPLTGDPDDVVYKTGDMGRYLSDRGIEFIGRLDTQVKVNGIRIELGEIEAALRADDCIDQAVVVSRHSRENDIVLVCYYTEKTATDGDRISAGLRQALPAYMMPSFYVRLDAMPLNINGKIDRKALPQPESLIYEEIAYEAPADETESALADIWAEVLGLPKVGVNSPFFLIGGHSLTATRVLARIYRDLGVEIHLKDFFAAPTIRGLAALLRRPVATGYTPIASLPQQTDYALSSSQRRLWLLDRLEEGGTAYSLPGLFRVQGPLDSDLLRRSCISVIERHESLRTTFVETDAGPRQKIHSAGGISGGFTLQELDWSQVADAENRAVKYARKQAGLPFDLAAGPLIRVTVMTVADRKHVVFFNLHHIIADAWSLDILARDVWAVYESLRSGGENPLTPLAIQYRDFTAWQHTRLEADASRQAGEYWRAKLSGAGAGPLNLPLDFPRPRLQTYVGRNFHFSLEQRTAVELAALAQKHDTSLFMVLLTLVKILLHRYTGQEDIVVGSPVACRNHPDLQEQIGFYANTLALRDHVTQTSTFASLLARVKQTVIEAFDHQDYPFDRLVDELNLTRDPGRAPLFDVMLVHREETHPTLPTPDLDIATIELDAGISRFDLTFEISKAPDGLAVAINYNTDLFREETIARMADHLRLLARTISTAGEKAVGELELLDAPEKQLLLEIFNDTCVPYPEELSIVDLFEAWARRRPDHIAVVLENGQLTYGELYRRARRLADVLVAEYRLAPEEMVALMVDRSEWSLIGPMAILMAGGAYLPLEPSAPQGRMEYILADSGCRVLLTQAEYLENSRSAAGTAIVADIAIVAPGNDASRDVSLARRPSPRSLAYVIYTSGSTGRPKGVMIEHGGFVNMVLDQIHTFDVSQGDRVVQFAAASFDASLSEIFMALLAGAAVVVVPRHIVDDPVAFVDYLEIQGVTHATLPPVYLNALDKTRLNSLTTIITAGEAPNYEDALSLSREKHYFNAYGPTEISVCATIERVTPYGDYRRAIPIGSPIANTSIYVLDETLKPLPIGLAGEICISGPGLARGYLNRPELTAEKFVAHPFETGARLYRTGDVGRWRADGKLEWLGRMDDQVKISGYRIELGEIKNTLLRYTEVSDAAVITTGQDSSVLAAYYTAAKALDPNEIKSRLARYLPHYMIPGHLIQLERLPLTTHGKLDHTALPEPGAMPTQADAQAAAPRTDFERWMLTLWREVLGNTNLGIHDNFFDAGGNSLRSLQLLARLSADSGRFELGQVPVKLLFLHPTVAELARELERHTSPAPLPGSEKEASIQAFPKAMTLAREPLLRGFDAGRIGPVNAAAVICLPDGLITGTGLGRDEIIRGFCGDGPVLSSITNTFIGRIAAIVLPCFTSEVFNDQGALKQQVAAALALADRIGADTVSLTGNLPTATDFGLDVTTAASVAKRPKITTGQATVAAAMGMTIAKMLQLSNRRLEQESVGLVGVNTIGAATLFLMLAGMPHPRKIVLADAYNNLLLAALLRQELEDCGFKGEIEIMKVTTELPEEFYEASLLIGATHVPEIIDIERVHPGTLLIEESGQRCFSREHAVRRLDERGDILFTEGDLLLLPYASTCELYLPEAVESALRRAGALSLLAFDPNAITGCILAGLLTQHFADLEPTIGEVDGQTCLRHFRHLDHLGFTVAAPRCEGYHIRSVVIRKFRHAFGVGDCRETCELNTI